MDKYFDACVCWVSTIERIHFAKFAVPFSKQGLSRLFYKANTNFDYSDFSNKKIGNYQILFVLHISVLHAYID